MPWGGVLLFAANGSCRARCVLQFKMHAWARSARKAKGGIPPQGMPKRNSKSPNFEEEHTMKTNKLGKILVVALFVMLFVLVLTVSVNAANTDVTTAEGLTTALGSAASGDTVTVTATIPITADTTINVPEGVTVQGSVNPLFKVTGANATLTVTGKGAINGTANIIEAAANGVKIVLNGGSLTTTGNANDGAIVIDRAVDTNTTVEITGATLKTDLGWAIDFYKNDTEGTGKKVIKMTAGSLTAEHAIVFNTNKADLSIDIQLSGGTHSGKNSVVYLRVAHSTNQATVAFSGATISNSAVDVGTSAKLNCTMSAGTFSTANYAFKISGSANATVNMTGGEIISAMVHNNEGLFFANSANATLSATVSGGKISAPKLALLGTASKSTGNAQITISNATVTCFDVINSNSGGNGSVTIGTGADVTSSFGILSTGGAYTQIAVNVTGGSLKAPHLCSNGGKAEYVMAGATLLNVSGGTVTVENAATVRSMTTTVTGGTLAMGGKTFAAAAVENTTTNVKYDSLEAAVAAASAGDTLTILNNIIVNANISVDKKLTIDAADGVSVLFNNAARFVLANGADVTFTDAKATYVDFGVLADFAAKGTAKMQFNGGVYSSTRDFFTITDLAALTLTFEDGCKFYQTANARIIHKYDNTKSNGYTTTTVVINGGYFECAGEYMFYSHNAEDDGVYLDITINGGEFVATKATGDINMFGTTDWQGRVNVKVHAGTFRVTSAEAISSAFRCNGQFLNVTIDEQKGDVLLQGFTYLVNGARYKTTLNVAGGEFDVKTAIYAYCNNGIQDATMTATITGGTFNCSGDFCYVADKTDKVNAENNNSIANITIDGKDVSITTKAAAFSVCAGGALTATLKNGKVTATNQLLYTDATVTTVTLNVQGGEVYSERNDTNGGLCWIGNVTNPTNINISGGKITSLTTPLVGVNGTNAAHAVTTISGGEINTHSLINENTGNGMHDVTISGGKITLVNNVFYDDGGGAKKGYMNVTMTGGEITAKSVFSGSPSTCLPQTFVIAGGKYNGATYIKSTDAENNLVKIGTAYYPNLQSALAAADDTNGAVTIELIGTQVLKDADGPIIINKNVIITSGHEGDASLMFYHEHANSTVVKLNGAYDTFRIEGGKSVTFTGNVTYINCGINVLGDGNATVTFNGNVKFDSGDDGHVLVASGCTASTLTVNVQEQAHLRGAHVIIGNGCTTVINVSVTGGVIETVSSSAMYVEGTTLTVNMSAGTVKGLSNAFKAKNGSANITVTGGSFDLSYHLFEMDGASATLKVSNATVVDCANLLKAINGGTHTLELTNVTASVRDYVVHREANVDGSHQTTVTFNSGKITCAGAKLFWLTTVKVNHTDLTINVKGGEILSTFAGTNDYSGARFVESRDGNGRVYVNVSGGTVKWSNATAASDVTSFVLSRGGDVWVNLTAGTIEGFDYVINAARSTTHVTAGAVDAEGKLTSAPTLKANKAVFAAYAYSHDNNAAALNATIHGGTYQSADMLFWVSDGTLISNSATIINASAKVVVNGGTFTANGRGVYVQVGGDGTFTFNNATFNTKGEVVKSETTSTSLTLTVKKGTYVSTNERVFYANSATNTVTLGTKGMNNADLVVNTKAASAKQVIASHKGSDATLNLTIWGGTYETRKTNLIDLNTNVAGSITIHEGLFTLTAEVDNYIIDVGGDNAAPKQMDIVINGGTVTNCFGLIHCNASTGKFEINGGNFTVNQNGSPASGDTARGALWFGASSNNYQNCVIQNCTITVKHNGTTDVGMLLYITNGKLGLTVKGDTTKLTATIKNSNTGMFFLQSAPVVDLTFEGTPTVECTNGTIFGFNGKATVTIAGGTIKAPHLVNMNGGSVNASVTITGTANVNLTGNLFIDAPNDAASQTAVTLAGGTLDADRLFGRNMNGTATLTITGGKYNGAAYVKNEEGVVRVGDTYYPSLKAALENVTGDTPEAPVTVTLVGGVTVSETILINKNVIITGGTDAEALLVYGAVTDRTPTGGTLKTFEIAPGKSVTFTGNVTYVSCGFYLADSTANDVTSVTFAGNVYINNYETDATGFRSYAIESRNLEAAGKFIVNVEDNARLHARHCIILYGADMNYEVNVKGGTITSIESSNLYFNGTTVTVKMSGGLINGVSHGIKAVGSTADIAITGGLIEVDSQGIELDNSKFNLSLKNATIKSKGRSVHVYTNSTGVVNVEDSDLSGNYVLSFTNAGDGTANAWVTEYLNGSTVKVNGTVSGTPGLIMNISGKTTLTSTERVINMVGYGNMLVNVIGDELVANGGANSMLVYRSNDTTTGAGTHWSVVNIEGGSWSTGYVQPFNFGNITHDTTYFTLNISGGNFTSTKATGDVRFFESWDANGQMDVNITGGNFKWENAAATEDVIVYLVVDNANKLNVNITGNTATFTGIDYFFWSARNTMNVTIGAEGATAFPTLTADKGIFHAYAYNNTKNSSTMNATIWGGSFTVTNGYVFYVSNGVHSSNPNNELTANLYFTIHNGTYTAKGLVYEQGGDFNNSNVGSTSNPVVIKNGTFTMTENLFHNRIGNMYVTIENGDFNVGDAIFRTYGGWNSLPEGDSNRKWRSPALGLTVKNGDFSGLHFTYHANGTLGTDAAPCVIENATINTTDTAFRFHDNAIRFRIDNATVTSGKTLFYCGTVVDTMSLTVNGGTYKCLKPSGATDGNENYRMFYLNGETGSNRWMTLNVNGGSFESTGEFIKAEDVVVKCTVNIKAGTIVAHSERGIYSSLNNSELHLNLGDANAVNDNSKLSITTEANAQVIALHGSGHTLDVNVYGGTFEAKVSSFIDINGGNNSGTVNIQGGKITTATSGIDIDGENKENTATVGDNVTVTTNFTKNADGSFTPVTKSEKANIVLNITGGTFSTGSHFIVSGNVFNTQANISGPVNVTTRNTAETAMFYHQNGSDTLTGYWMQVNISATEAGTPTFLNYSDRMFGQANIGGNVVDSAYFDIHISGGVFKMARPTGGISFFMAWDGNGAMNVDISGGTFKWQNPDSTVTESLTWLTVFRNQANLLNANVSGGTFENIDLFVYNNRSNSTANGKVVSTTNVAVSGTAKVIGAVSTQSWGLFLCNVGGNNYETVINAYISGGELSANNEPMMHATNTHIINATIVGGKLTATAGNTNLGMFAKDGAAGEITVNIGGTAEVTYANGPIFGYFGKVTSTISGGTINGYWLTNANNNSYVHNINITGGTLNFTRAIFAQGGAPADAAKNRMTVNISGGVINAPRVFADNWNFSSAGFLNFLTGTLTYNGLVIDMVEGKGVRDGNVENGTIYPTLHMALENAIEVEGVKTLVIVDNIVFGTTLEITGKVVVTGGSAEAPVNVLGNINYKGTDSVFHVNNGAELTLNGYVNYRNCMVQAEAGTTVTFAGNIYMTADTAAESNIDGFPSNPYPVMSPYIFAYRNDGVGNATVNVTENAHLYTHYSIYFEGTADKNSVKTVNISGGKVHTNEHGFAINLNADAAKHVVNMTGGSIKGNHCIYMNSNGTNELNISGGTIETLRSSALYQTGSATGTINFSGTASITGIASSIKATGGSTMNINITGGTFNAKWRVVEMDNANGNVVIKNATVTKCASLFYGVNAGTRTLEVDNVTMGEVTDTVLVMTVGTHTVNVNGLTVTGAVTAHLFYTSGDAKVTATLENVKVVTSSRTFKINGASDDVNVTIKSGSYTVNNTASDDYVIGTAGSATLNLTVNIEGGTFRNTGKGGYFFGSSNGTTTFNISGGDINVANYVFAYWGAKKATINISGGTLTAPRILNTTNAPGATLGHTFDVTLNGEQVEKSFNYVMNVSGGTLTSTERTFSMVDNTYVYVHISGGNVVATGGYVVYRSDHTDKNYPGQAGAGEGYSYVLITGGKIEAASSVVETNDAYLDVRIENGEFNHASWLFHVTQDTGNNGMAYATLEIVGGTFKSKDGKGGGICSDNFNEMTVSVTGGTFNYSWEMVKINGSANANVTLGGTVNVTAPRIFWANTGATSNTSITVDGGTYMAATHFIQLGVTGEAQTNATVNVTVKGNANVTTNGNLFHARGGVMNVTVESGKLYTPGVAFLSDSDDMTVTLVGGELSATVLLQFANSGTIKMTGEDSENVTIRVNQTCLDHVYYDDAEGNRIYAGFVGAVNNAPAGATIYVVGNMTITETANRVGDLTIAGNGTVTGSVVFINVVGATTLTFDGNVTYSGTVSIVQIPATATPFESTVNFTKGIFRVSGGSTTGAVFVDYEGDSTTTVNVYEGADIRVGGWGIAFETGRDADGSGEKTVNMTGGYLSGSHGLTFGAGGVQINLYVSGGTIEVTNDALYLHNKYYKTDAQENLLNVNITGGTFIAKTNVILFAGNANGTINISGGTFQANDIVEMGSTNDVTNSSLKMPGYNGTEEAFNAVINITGGTFEANEKGIYTLGGSRAYVSISDATFVAKQQLIVRRDDGYTGKGYTYVVINGGSYTGVTDTMFWLRDSKLDLVVNAGTDGSEPTFVSTKHFVYVYQNSGSTFAPVMNFTMNAGTVDGNGYTFAFLNNAVGNVTINGGTINNVYKDSNNAAIGAIDGGADVTVNMTGGVINSPDMPAFGRNGKVTVNISGGEINTGYLMNANGTVADETVNVSGNAVINASIAVLTDGTAGSKQFLNISGGTINSPLLATGSFAVTVSVTVTGGTINVRDYTFGATQNVVMNQTTGKLYNDLQDAVNEASDGDVIEILGDFVLTKQVVVENKTLVITGGSLEQPITVFGAFYNRNRDTNVYATFLFKSGANVTLTGNVTYLESAVILEGDDIVLTLSGNVKLDSERRSHVIYNNNAHADGDVTVYIAGNATLVGNYAVYFTGDKSMKSTDAKKSAIMSGGLIDANHGLLFQYINGVNGLFHLTGGKIDVLYSAIWLDSHNVDGKRITVILDGVTIESEDVAVTANKNADLLTDITVYAGTYIHAGLDGISADSGDCAITLETNANAKPSTLTIYGGTFISETGHAAVQVTSRSAVNANATEATGSKTYIYGGYFVGKTLCAVRASGGGYLYIYGGYFAFDSTDGNGGSPVRSGTGSTSANSATIGNVFVYGGNYYSHSTGAAFATVNELCNLEVKINGVNANGGAYLVNKTNGMVYYGDGERHRDGLISMTDGAGVRIVKDSNGLRFVSVVTGEALAYLDSIGATNVKFGTLIAPVDIVAQARTFTIADMKAAGLPYLNIVAKDGLVERAAGGYYIRAAITNIQEGNVGREFAAVGYITYTIISAQGEPVEMTVYTSYRENKNARSIEQVARLALKEAELYTAAQLEILREYAPETEAPVIDFYLVAGQSNAAGSSAFTEAMKEINPAYKNGYEYILYSGSSNRTVRLGVPTKLGFGSGDYSFGPEMGMADAMSQFYNEETGRYAAIIKYAYGGTRLYDNLSGSDAVEGSWCPPSWLAVNKPIDEVRSGGLFRAFVNHIESCVADYEAMGFDVNIQSVYWMQGESDINAHAKDGLYDDIFKVWISDLRNSVCDIMNDDTYQSLPIIVGEISEYFNSSSDEAYHRKNLEFVQMQREVIGSWDNVYVIPQGNVPTVDYDNDNAHWGFHEHVWNGYMVGSKMLEIAHGFYTTVSEEEAVAEVWLDGQLLGTYNNLGGALSMAPEGAVVKLLKDIEMQSTLAIGNRNKITLDGCDHKIDYRPIQHTAGGFSAIKCYNTDIVIMNLHVVNHSYTEHDANGAEIKLATYGVVLHFNAKVTWMGGSLEVERHGFVLNNAGCELNIVSGDFQLRETAITYAAVVFIGSKNTKVTIDGGNFDGGEGTAYIVYLEADANGSKVAMNGGTYTPGTDCASVVKNHCTDATIIVGDEAVLNGAVENAGKSE